MAMLLTGAVLLAGPVVPAAEDPVQILSRMDAAVRGVRDYTMRLVKQERLRGTLEPEQTLLVKWARPFRVYMKAVAGPSTGQEVLYVSGWNGGRFRVHKGSFPDITLNLHPRSSFAMAHTHHPVSEASLGHLAELVMAGLREQQRRGVGSVRLAGVEAFDGRRCHVLELTAPSDAVTDTVRPGESLWDVAARHGVEAYALLHANRGGGWRSLDDVRPGRRVRVPRFYAGRTRLWIDAATFLPLKALIWDHAGDLYERYEHHDLRVDVGLDAAEFRPDHPAYRF